MRTRLIVLAAFVAFLGIGGVAGAYFYDDSKKDLIAEGVKVNGVPIGGMTRAEAEKKLSATLLAPLDRPVKVTYKDRTFTLSQKAAAIGIDIRGSVDKALKRSQEGDMFSRTLAQPAQPVAQPGAGGRGLLQQAVDRQARQARAQVARAQAGGREGRPQQGLHRRARLEDRPAREVQHAGQGGRDRRCSTRATRTTVKIKTTVVQPKVSTAQLAKKYPAVLIVDRGSFKLTLYKNLKKAKTYGIAVGQVGLDTPAGLYTIQNKAVNPAWHVPNSALGGRPGGQGHRRR